MAKTSKQDLKGYDSVKYCVASLLGIGEDKLPADGGINWYPQMREWAAEQGYQMSSQFGSQTVDEKHIGLFHSEGQLYAVVMDGDKVIDNPSGIDTAAASLTNRLVFTKESRQSLTGQDAKAKEDK